MVQGAVDEATLASFRADAAHEKMRATFRPSEKDELPEYAYRSAFPHALLSETARRPPSRFKNDLLQDLTGLGHEYVAVKAMEVVLRGIERALRSAPEAGYCKLVTVDREEIERINEIRRLMISYQATATDRRPLSIAVFGTPSSGKSFAIKQLAEALFGRGHTALDFNLSQFERREDLLRTFNQVRDATVQGQIPLVFWDEFDTGELKWLQDFLVPMQDAKYYAGGVEHPFGKVIFVFAGGTCRDFQEFDKSTDPREDGRKFRQAKGPDFVSRLRGYVNIKGPNPTPEPSDGGRGVAGRDVAHLIRRAILLRKAIETLHPHFIDPASGMAAVSASVVRGFLRAEEFHHGARSMEAIVGMSALAGRTFFGVAELPSPDLLQLHVTPDFPQWVHEGELEVAAVEVLAAAIHDAWRQRRENDGYQFGPERDDQKKSHPLLKPYRHLLEGEKEQSRISARVTLAKLLEIGYRVAPVQSPGVVSPQSKGFTFEERKRLIEIEHDIWLRNHLLEGYARAEQTNDRLRLHRDIAPLGEQPPVEKQVNEAIVDSIPGALEKAGYVLVKIRDDMDRVRVGVTGHRYLMDVDRVVDGVRKAIRRIQALHGGCPLTVVSGLAEGADRIAAEEILRTSDSRLVAVLPFPREEYALDFGPDGSPSPLHFDALLARASDVEIVKLESRTKREESYDQAGVYIVDNCDVLLAVWDGEDAQGQGGTAAIVARARQQKKPVVIVRAGNRKLGIQEPTSLGEEQGRVILDGLTGQL